MASERKTKVFDPFGNSTNNDVTEGRVGYNRNLKLSPSNPKNLILLMVSPLTVVILQSVNFPSPLPFLIVFLAYRIIYIILSSDLLSNSMIIEYFDDWLQFAQSYESRISLVGISLLKKNVLAAIDHKKRIVINSFYYPYLSLLGIKALILHEIAHLSNIYGIYLYTQFKSLIIIIKNSSILIIGVLLAFYVANLTTCLFYLIFIISMEEYLRYKEELTCDQFVISQLGVNPVLTLTSVRVI